MNDELTIEYIAEGPHRYGVHVCAICEQPLQPGRELTHYEAHRGRQGESLLLESTSLRTIQR